jgi:hypothetical protein
MFFVFLSMWMLFPLVLIRMSQNWRTVGQEVISLSFQWRQRRSTICRCNDHDWMRRWSVDWNDEGTDSDCI